MTILETIKKRKSIRTFENQVIRTEDLEFLNNYLKSYDPIGPFGNKIILSEMRNQNQLGTYGIIKRPQMYIAGICDHTDQGLLDFGYIFEAFILAATEQGLGTCWMAGTFKRKDLLNDITMNENQLLPAITPLGYPEKSRLFENLMRGYVKADKRKTLEEILFSTSFKPIKNNLYPEAYESVRLGPSASNKQPWRIIQDNDLVHFYLDYSDKYNEALSFKVQLIDMGIAMYHFEKVLNKTGIWSQEDPKLETQFRYISTYTLHKESCE